MPNPDLMVIGDSLAQGVQSMSFRPDFATQCVGARLATLQGWPFNPQTHPRPVLFDAEGEVRQISTLEIVGAVFFTQQLLQGLCDRINANLEQWMVDLVDPAPASDVAPMDNLAVGGAVVGDLLQPASYWRGILSASRDFKFTADNLSGNAGKISDFFKAINYAYILNPGRDPALENMCVMDWVQQRSPNRLLVTIGHNDGDGSTALWNVGFDADNNLINIGQLARLDDLITRLAALNPAQWICWDLLPKISSVASLDPVGTKWTGSGAGKTDNYCDVYQPVVIPGTNQLTGAQLQAIDQSILATNAAIQARLNAAFTAAGKIGKLRFFDDYAFFASLDFKNQPNYENPASQAMWVNFPFQSWTQHVDNRYISGTYRPIPGAQPQGKIVPEAKMLVAGGLQSLDGMHPTGIGYLCKAVALTKQPDLGLTPIVDPKGWLTVACKDNTLTDDFPVITNTLCAVIRAIQDALILKSHIAGAPPTVSSLNDNQVQVAKAWVNTLVAPCCKRP